MAVKYELNSKSRMKCFMFYPVSEFGKIAKDTRCLILDSKGHIDIAVWDGANWMEEGSLIYSGGIGGKITEKDVIEFSILD